MNGAENKSLMVNKSTGRVAPHQRVLGEVPRSLNHQAEFVPLVAPLAWEAPFALVVVGEFSNLGFGDLKRSLVVNVLVVARAKMVDDTDGLTHEVHHVLWVGTPHVVFSQDLADSLAEHKADVGDSVLVPQDRSDLC